MPRQFTTTSISFFRNSSVRPALSPGTIGNSRAECPSWVRCEGLKRRAAATTESPRCMRSVAMAHPIKPPAPRTRMVIAGSPCRLDDHQPEDSKYRAERGDPTQKPKPEKPVILDAGLFTTH